MKRHLQFCLLFVLPLFLIFVLSLVASSVSTKDFRQRLMDRWEVSRISDRIRLTGLDGWPLPWSELMPSAAHDHTFPSLTAITTPETGIRLVFAHMGDGQIPGTTLSFQTSLVLSNDSKHPTTGTIRFFDDLGQPLVLSLNGQKGSEFQYDLSENETKHFDTSGLGPVKSGWILVQSEQPIDGVATFGIRTATGEIVTDVGVGAAQMGSEFTIFADSLGLSRTGIALSNPGEDPVDLHLTLYDLNGSSKAVKQRQLPPKGHLGVFLDELYSDVVGIEEFEGSVMITSIDTTPADTGSEGSSPAQFAGVTLRSTGPLLTSLPFVAPVPSESTISKMAFPHVGDGLIAGLKIKTSTVLFNTHTDPANGIIEFFNSDSTPMEVEIDGRKSSSFEFSLPPRGVQRITTAGTGGAKVGWARVSMDRHLNGSAIFQISEAEATTGLTRTEDAEALIAEVGVGATKLIQTSKILVDTEGPFNTGVAIANPVSPDEHGESPLRATFALFDNSGRFIQSTQREIPPLGHTALFVTELFEDQGQTVDIEDFSGFLLVFTNEPAAPLSLRSVGPLLTSVPPIFGDLNGFAPESSLSFAQNLGGTAPSLEWTIHQNGDDLALEHLHVSVPRARFNIEQVSVGESIAHGYLSRGSNSRMMRILVTAIDGKALTIETMIDKADGLYQQGVGTITNEDAALELDLTLLGKQPFTEIAEDADQHYFFPSGLIELPIDKAAITVQTRFDSVSYRPDQNLPIIRLTEQNLPLQPPADSAPNIVSVAPLFSLPGDTLTIRGSNFETDPIVLFPMPSGETLPALADLQEDGTLLTVVPKGVSSGAIRIERGQESSNAYRMTFLFNPLFDLDFKTMDTTGTQQDNPPKKGLTFSISQAIDQLIVADFDLELVDTEIDLPALSVGQLIGSGKRQLGYDESTFDLKLAALEGNLLKVDFVSPYNSEARLGDALEIESFEPTAGRFKSTRISYFPRREANEPFLTSEADGFLLEFTLGNLPLISPEGQRAIIANSVIVSAPRGSGGSDSRLRVYQSASVLRQEDGNE